MPIETNGIHEENLQIVATFLAFGEAPKGVAFDMPTFADNDFEATTCGTSGCVVGWAPFAGIEKDVKEDWIMYSRRTLIDYPLNPKAEQAWDWCFTGCWADVDNTRLGAAKRIQYLLDNGIDAVQDLEMDPAIYADTEVKR